MGSTIIWCTVTPVNISAGCRDITEELENGAAIFTPGTVTFSIGERISFKCDPNFKLAGAAVLTCDSGQRWTSEVPQCVPDTTVKSRSAVRWSGLWISFLFFYIQLQ